MLYETIKIKKNIEMKSIKQIFSTNPELMKNENVQELIDYCYELEEKVIDNNQENSLEVHLSVLIREIYDAILVTKEDDKESIRFNDIERVDYEEAFNNLKKVLERFSLDYKFNLRD